MGRFSVCTRWLEDDFYSELSVEGFTGPDARSSVVVSDRVVEGEVAADGDAAATGRSVVDAVEEVEHLCPELEGHELLDLRVFEEGEIDIRVTRTVVTVATA